MAKLEKTNAEIRAAAARIVETSKELSAESQHLIRAAQKIHKMAKRVRGGVKLKSRLK